MNDKINENYYELFDLPKNFSEEDIKKKYHFLCMCYHPDRFLNEDHKKIAEKKFKKIQTAYKILSDPIKRSEYDKLFVKCNNKNSDSSEQIFRNGYKKKNGYDFYSNNYHKSENSIDREKNSKGNYSSFNILNYITIPIGNKIFRKWFQAHLYSGLLFSLIFSCYIFYNHGNSVILNMLIWHFLIVFIWLYHGYNQWKVLSFIFPKPTIWVFSSFISFLLSFFITMTLCIFHCFLCDIGVNIYLLWLFLDITQWMILKNYFQKTNNWLLNNIVSYIASLAVMTLIIAFIILIMILSGNTNKESIYPFLDLVVAFMCLVIWLNRGLFSGIFLIRMIERSKSQ